MKAIIDNKLYDTETADKIYSFKRQVDKGPVLWNPKMSYRPYHVRDLYKTQKGNWFEFDTVDNRISAITEKDAQYILQELSPDTYIANFGEVEGA